MAGPNFTLARAAIVLTLVAIGAGFLGYNLHPGSTLSTGLPINGSASNTPVPMPQVPVQSLDREAFLVAASRAASDFAIGSTATPAAPLVGRQFEIRIPFGCLGPSPVGMEGQGFWRNDPSNHSIQVGIRPENWTGAPWRYVLDPQFKAEAIEGFWIPRPWILDAKCPGSSDNVSGSPQPPPPSVGLAVLYAKGGARTERRDKRPYEVTRPARDDATTPGPFVLVLSGRVAGYSDGAAFHCLAARPDERPVCLAAVEISRVRIEVAKSGEILGDWDG